MDEYNPEESKLIQIAERMYLKLKEMPPEREPLVVRVIGSDPQETEHVRQSLLGFLFYSDAFGKRGPIIERVFNPDSVCAIMRMEDYNG